MLHHSGNTSDKADNQDGKEEMDGSLFQPVDERLKIFHHLLRIFLHDAPDAATVFRLPCIKKIAAKGEMVAPVSRSRIARI